MVYQSVVLGISNLVSSTVYSLEGNKFRRLKSFASQTWSSLCQAMPRQLGSQRLGHLLSFSRRISPLISLPVFLVLPTGVFGGVVCDTLVNTFELVNPEEVYKDFSVSCYADVSIMTASPVQCHQSYTSAHERLPLSVSFN